MKFSLVLQPACLLKLILNLFCTINFQEGELYLPDFIKYAFNFGMRQNICKLICFKLGMMLDMTNLYSMILVWMT